MKSLPYKKTRWSFECSHRNLRHRIPVGQFDLGYPELHLGTHLQPWKDKGLMLPAQSIPVDQCSISTISRPECRREAETRFGIPGMNRRAEGVCAGAINS